MSTLIQNWVDAMRSGKFKKGEGVLYNSFTGCHCALGVLADVMGLRINSNGDAIVGDYDENLGYKPIEDTLGGALAAADVYSINDERMTKNGIWKRKCDDYSEVIAFVEKTYLGKEAA